jgi:hypothetical protein
VRLILGPIERCDGLPVLAAEPFWYQLCARKYWRAQRRRSYFVYVRPGALAPALGLLSIELFV